jgi:molybdopterin-guanine dinucleotide biosynthesis protein MobB
MMKPHVVAVVGGKKVGKTTTVENLIREFVKRKYKVAAIKHVSEKDFTIDTPGKDTWRFAQAGARTIVSAAANEVTTIQKVSLESLSLKDLLIKCKDSDFVFTEGLKGLVGKEPCIQKIVVVKTAGEAEKALKLFSPILAFSGPYCTKELTKQIPYADAVNEPEKLANIVERFFAKN